MDTQRNCFAGSWVPSGGAETIDVVDPATDGVVARIPAGTGADADAAVAAARSALPKWRATPAQDRAAIVRAQTRRVLDAAADLARLESMEMGKPVAMAQIDIEGTAPTFDYYADLAAGYFERALGEAEWTADFVVRESRGVAALILPWNYPIVIALQYLPGLLVAGNTVVLKPSERSPLSAIRLMELLDLPDGVVNLLLGDGRAAAPLVAHPGVDFVSLTGSTATGRRVAEECGRRLRPMSLELGGKDAVIVDAGLDPQWAAEQVAVGAFTNTGQICTSMERVYVHEAIAGAFTTALVARARAEVVGPGEDPATTMGPMVDERQRAIVVAHVEDALARGARALTGGAVPQGPGAFYPPTVLVDVTDDMLVMREETFGPVAPVRVVASFDEALELACRSEFGLAATVLTADEEHAARAAAELPVAIVWINEWQGGHPDMEYEPARASGVGAAGGKAWLDTVTRPKAVHRARPAPA